MSRVDRLNEQFRREAAEVLRLRVRDPRVTGVTVTGARVTADLSSAKIFVQLSEDPRERREQERGLAAATSYVRGVLGRTLTLRHMPEIRFVPDDTETKARRIEELLDQVRTARESSAGDGERGEEEE